MAGDAKTHLHLEREALAHAAGLYNLARRLTGDDASAQDLVQDTYARAWSALATFTAGTHMRAWLFRILRNAFIDKHRRRDREPQPRDDIEDLALTSAIDDVALDRVRSRVGVDVENALRALPEEQCTVILLDLEDLNEREISEVLGCAVGTVKSRLSRARAALRVSLAEYAPTAATKGAAP
ncbi:MAG TPA: sigma-70 family RNA polymerase sigma factor [Myxococcota bacterium]